jgi:epoxyqueuosine reductase
VKQQIAQRARELGFDDCRFTSAASPETARQFESWLQSEQHGRMAYLARNAHKRVDPQRVLPGAKSIITLAVSYEQASTFGLHDSSSSQPSVSDDSKSGEPVTTDYGQQTNSEPTGVIARYARFDDYHEVIGDRLKKLAAFVNELGNGTRSRCYVDTGPLLERDLAQRAGLGFVGKHTNLISRRFGNWIFLAEILTTLELEPDPPERNRCGSCTRCIGACPTQAITGPFQLDARRCISYLTIELKDAIPVELRPAIGNRIFGCDDCLAVCPWNKFAREGSLMKEHARPDLGQPNLIELLSLDEAGFRRKFAGTPILRAKRRGLLRNVCVALGNVGDATVLPALERAATDSEPLIAEHARWAIAQVQSRNP